MGFLDKAKKMAEQAQSKLDEAQKQFNQQPGQPSGGPVVEYDKHGRPIQREPAPPPAPAPAPPESPAAGAPTASMPPAAAPGPTAPPPVVAPGGDPGTSLPAEPVEETVGHGEAETAPGPPPHEAQSAHPGSQGVPQDRNRESYEPPKMSSGDPLAG